MPTQNANGAPFAGMTAQEKVQAVAGLLYFPALTVLVFLRGKLGFRRIKLSSLISMALILAVLGSFTAHPTSGTPFPVTALGLFGFVVLIVGGVQNRRRWRDLCNGVRWHTLSTGVSWLTKLVPYLPFKVSEHIVHRYFDPIACILVGLILSIVSPPLGMWVMFSGVSLAGFEQFQYDRQIDHMLNTLDAIEDSDVQRENVSGRGQTKPRSIEQTAGISTGVAPDIERQVAARQREQAQSVTIITPGSGQFGL
jgi:hypothetical protein